MTQYVLTIPNLCCPVYITDGYGHSSDKSKAKVWNQPTAAEKEHYEKIFKQELKFRVK